MQLPIKCLQNVVLSNTNELERYLCKFHHSKCKIFLYCQYLLMTLCFCSLDNISFLKLKTSLKLEWNNNIYTPIM